MSKAKRMRLEQKLRVRRERREKVQSPALKD
jgi:hypothetical protein